MPFLVTRNGVQRAIADDSVSAYQAAGWTIGQYVAPEATAVDANGGLYVDPAAAQAQQQFVNDIALAQGLDRQRQTGVNAFTARTGAYNAQTERFNALVPLLGESKNMGLLANVVAGDPRAAGLAVGNAVSRLAGPAPTAADYSGVGTYQAADLKDFARQAIKDYAGGSTSAERAAGGQQGGTASQGAQAGQQGASGSQEAATTTITAGGTGGASWGAGGRRVGTGRDSRVAQSAGVDYGYLPSGPGGERPVGVTEGTGRIYVHYRGADGSEWDTPYAAGTPAYSAYTARGGGAPQAQTTTTTTTAAPATTALSAPSGQGGAQPAATTAAAPTDLGAYGDLSGISGEGDSSIPWKNVSHNLIRAYKYGHGSAARNAAHKAAGLTGEQFDRLVKHGKNPFAVKSQAGGGTTTVKPPLFTPPTADATATPDMATAGLPTDQAAMLDPHDPHQSPEQLAEIRAILSAPADPDPSPLEQEVRACWRLDGAGHPVYQHVSGSLDAQLRDVAQAPTLDMAQQPDGSYADAGMPTEVLAGGGTYVVRKPTLFAVGRQPFLVGEHGHDELIGLEHQPAGGVVVHVDPLQNRAVALSPADAAVANAAVRGAPYRPHAAYGPLVRAEAGGTYSVGEPIASAGTKLVPAAKPYDKKHPNVFISPTGQVRVPGRKAGKWVTVPYYMAQRFPDPTQAPSSTVDEFTPLDQEALGQLTQQRVGYGYSNWSALQQRSRPWWQRPVVATSYGR